MPTDLTRSPSRPFLLLFIGLSLIGLPLLFSEAAAEQTEDVLYYTPTEEGFIMDWLVSVRHPFPYYYIGATMNYDGLATIGGEKNVVPVAGMQAAKGKPWLERHFQSKGWARGVFEFRPASMYMTYTFIHIYSEEEKKDLVLLTGSDDALLVLLNSKQVQKVQMQRGYNTDQDRVAGITLNKGWNRLMCKIDDYMGGHGLVVRFKTKDAEPVTDLKICLSKPAEGVKPNFVDGAVYEAEAAKILKEAMRFSAEEGNFGKAGTLCRKVVAQYPKSKAAAEALYQAGDLLLKQQKPDKALKTFDELLTSYPYAKWAEDALVAKAQTYRSQQKPAESEKTLEALLEQFPSSSLVPEAMLGLAGQKAARGDLDESDAILGEVRQRYANTVEWVKALDALADNQAARKNLNKARELWRQVMEEAKTLSEGKYVWYVNVQTLLQTIADGARKKITGK